MDIISIPDDDSSFSSVASDDDDEDYDDDCLKIPARDYSQQTSVGSASSPTWNTQPSASALKKKKTNSKKKRTTPPKTTTTANTTKDKKRKVSLSPKEKDNTQKQSKATKKKSNIEKEMELLEPLTKQKTRAEVLASFADEDDSDEDDDLVAFVDLRKKKKPGTPSPPAHLRDADYSVRNPFAIARRKRITGEGQTDSDEDYDYGSMEFVPMAKRQKPGTYSPLAANRPVPEYLNTDPYANYGHKKEKTAKSDGKTDSKTTETPLGGVLCSLPDGQNKGGKTTPDTSATVPEAKAKAAAVKPGKNTNKENKKATPASISELPRDYSIPKKGETTTVASGSAKGIADAESQGKKTPEAAKPKATKSVLEPSSGSKVLWVESAPSDEPVIPNKKSKTLTSEASTSAKPKVSTKKKTAKDDAKKRKLADTESASSEPKTTNDKAGNIINPDASSMTMAKERKSVAKKKKKNSEVSALTTEQSDSDKAENFPDAKAKSGKPTKKKKAAGSKSKKGKVIVPFEEKSTDASNVKPASTSENSGKESSKETAVDKPVKSTKAGAKSKKDKSSNASKENLDSTSETKKGVEISKTCKSNKPGEEETSKNKIAEPTLQSGDTKKASSKPKAVKAVAAGTKPKPKKKRFDQQILHHMVTAMKPFLVRGLAQELKSTEQQLNYALLSMKDKGLILEKEFTSSKGRTKTLIWANLESKAKDAIQVEYSQEKGVAAKQEIELLFAEEKHLQQELSDVNSLPCNEDLTAQVTAEEANVAQLKKRLEETRSRIKAGEAPSKKTLKPGFRHFQAPVKSAAQLAKERDPRHIKKRINAFREHWKSRKQKCHDFVDNLAEAMEKKPKDVYKLLDIETDEMEGVTMPARYEIDP